MTNWYAAVPLIAVAAIPIAVYLLRPDDHVGLAVAIAAQIGFTALIVRKWFITR
jgi:hypothetical protein